MISSYKVFPALLNYAISKLPSKHKSYLVAIRITEPNVVELCKAITEGPGFELGDVPTALGI
jgi:hypothetical protein